MLNEVILVGKLNKDPIVRQGSNDRWFATFLLEVGTGKYRAYIPCIFDMDKFNDFEETVKQDVTCIVKGSLQNNNFTDKKGNAVKTMQVHVFYFRIIDNKD